MKTWVQSLRQAYLHRQAHCRIQEAADGRLDETQQQALDAHLAGCASCRVYAEEIRALESQLRQVGRTMELVISPTKLAATSFSSRQRTAVAIHARYRRYQMKNRFFSFAGVLAVIGATIVVVILINKLLPTTSTLPVAGQPISTQALTTATPELDHLSLQDARTVLGFDFLIPIQLPTGFYFQNASYTENDQVRSVVLSYGDGMNGPNMQPIEITILVGETRTLDDIYNGQGGGPGPEAYESLTVRGRPALYFQGCWTDTTGTVYDRNCEANQFLTWFEGGARYSIQSFVSNHYAKDILTSIAQGMALKPPATLKPGPVATSAPYDLHIDFPLTLEQAREQAGFDVLTPTNLPETSSFLGARYDAVHAVILLLYLDDNSGSEDFELSEQLVPADGRCDLCGFIVGDLSLAEANYAYTVVGSDAVVQTVQIGDVTGQYVEGAWYADDDTGIKWHNDPMIKILRWQAHGVAYELARFGGVVIYSTVPTNEVDLVAIAESMK